jgi:hypothetical protein
MIRIRGHMVLTEGSVGKPANIANYMDSFNRRVLENQLILQKIYIQ